MAQSSTTKRARGRTVARQKFPRISAGRQSRLTALLEKVGEVGLTLRERAELERLLFEVDRRTFWGLADMLMTQLDRRRRRQATG